MLIGPVLWIVGIALIIHAIATRESNSNWIILLCIGIGILSAAAFWTGMEINQYPKFGIGIPIEQDIPSRSGWR